MKKAVVFGAGNIGRGFIGQVLNESGYEVVFIEINHEIVEKMNQEGCYPIKVVSDQDTREILVHHIRAVHGSDPEGISKEMADADIMATAVGVNVLSQIAENLAKGLQTRWKNQNLEPLNIIICENLINANRFLKDEIEKELNEGDKLNLNELVGFVEASIGRMVPVMTPEMLEGNILRVCVEEYRELPVDKDGFKGTIPSIVNMIPFSPFEYHIHRKLFVHNMGHAITAYLGYLKGYQTIWEAIEDEEIKKICRGAMLESARALSNEYKVELEELQIYVEDLLSRFGNHLLGDTIDRVGRDLKRKLSPNDRLIGAFNLCIKNGILPRYICMGITAALQFKDPLKSI